MLSGSQRRIRSNSVSGQRQLYYLFFLLKITYIIYLTSQIVGIRGIRHLFTYKTNATYYMYAF